MKTADRVIIVIFILCIFSVLPFFLFGKEGDGVKVLGSFKEPRDFSGQPLEGVLSAIDRQQVALENRLTARTPLYTDILLFNRNIDMALSRLFFGAPETGGFRPVGNTTGNPVMINAAEDMLIWKLSMGTDEERSTKIAQQAALFNSIAEALPDAHTAVYAVTDIWNSQAGEAAGLGPEAGLQYLKEFSSQLSPKIAFDYLPVPDIKAYRRMFFMTDHHWNIQGAYEGYLGALALLEPASEPRQAPLQGDFFRVDGVVFQGSRARAASISTINDELWDIDAPYPSFRIWVNDKAPDERFSLKEKYLRGEFDKTPFINHYAAYFHSEYAKITYEREGVKNGKNLLLITDSNSDCMDKLLASHFDNTYLVNVAYWKKEFAEEFNVKKFAQGKAITHVLVLEGVYAILYNNGNIVIEVQ